MAHAIPRPAEEIPLVPGRARSVRLGSTLPRVMDCAYGSPMAVDGDVRTGGDCGGGEGLYPTSTDTAAHAVSLPRSVGEFASAVRAMSADAADALRRGAGPPPEIWPRAYRMFCELFGRYAVSPMPVFHSADPLRRAVGRYLVDLGAAPVETHAELSTRLLFCAHWCCLGHAFGCSRQAIYERECARFFEARLGIGETPPADSERYWVALLDMAGADPELFPRHAAAAAYLRTRGRKLPLPLPPQAGSATVSVASQSINF
uniref:Virion protein US10 homolog n=1 Tax=Equid alphaherpesvirus 4 TaxID=10331 RepID=A0A0Y0A4D7_9ALPH|nr:virion protein US10 [Equid alphaherpesvirus 4]AMB15961.1 virion protein US10 [Equid alphaherpesvirus 4]AMB16033.1 virion protein US10 [Equid alphaherpesvirus 4]AMB16040.1 virion protein US10 [Equid alphaherpesvirus 4]AMB16665.1 virion protein US10 [Equid alphaherpesvirus 4]